MYDTGQSPDSHKTWLCLHVGLYSGNQQSHLKQADVWGLQSAF